MDNDLVARSASLFLRAAAGLVEKVKGNPDKFAVAKMLRWFAEKVDEGEFDSELERMQLTYEEQMKICADRKLIYFDFCRNHNNSVECEREVL